MRLKLTDEQKSEAKAISSSRRKEYTTCVSKRIFATFFKDPVFKGDLSAMNAKVNLETKMMGALTTKVSRSVISVLCGTIFGDGSLGVRQTVTYRAGVLYCKGKEANMNFRLTFKHTTRQAEWFFWKVHILKYFIPDAVAVITFSPPDGYQESAPKSGGEVLGKWQLQSHVHEDLTILKKILYYEKNKIFQRSWLNHMDTAFLMTLWLDDGSLMNQVQGVFCLNSTPKEELEVLNDYFKTVWDLGTKVISVPSKKTATNPTPHEIIFIDNVRLKQFLLLIAGIVPVKSMLYKVCFFDIDSDNRKRWTDDLKSKVRFEWHSYLDEYYLGLLALEE